MNQDNYDRYRPLRREDIDPNLMAALLNTLACVFNVHPWDAEAVGTEDANPIWVKRWEDEIFTEGRLYDALGKEDARAVLSVWKAYQQARRIAIASTSLPIVRWTD